MVLLTMPRFSRSSNLVTKTLPSVSASSASCSAASLLKIRVACSARTLADNLSGVPPSGDVLVMRDVAETIDDLAEMELRARGKDAEHLDNADRIATLLYVENVKND